MSGPKRATRKRETPKARLEREAYERHMQEVRAAERAQRDATQARAQGKPCPACGETHLAYTSCNPRGVEEA